ncbi:MAG: hypothetical protein ACI8T1_004352 [Verrucomicrobiales bacterium]|jgi:hypothetical protein
MDGQDYLRITDLTATDKAWLLTWTSGAGIRHVIEHSVSLEQDAWEIAEELVGAEETSQISVGANAREFFRIRVEP